MGGKNASCPDDLDSLTEGKLLILHQEPDLLEPEEGRMSLVHMAYGRLYAELPEQPYTADTEHYLLLYPFFIVTSIELIRDVMIRTCVKRKVRVHQEELDAANMSKPGLCLDPPARKVQGNSHGLATAVLHLLNRHVVEVIDRIAFCLPAVIVQVLPEISALVQEAYPDQRDAEVGG